MLSNKLIEREPDYGPFVVSEFLEAVAPERVTMKRR